MLLAQRSQTFALRSSHGNHPGFVSFSFEGDEQHRQCQRLPPNLASLELPGDVFLSENPEISIKFAVYDTARDDQHINRRDARSR